MSTDPANHQEAVELQATSLRLCRVTYPRLLISCGLLAAFLCGLSDVHGAPAAMGKGLVGSIDGFDPTDYTGQVLVLNFWATWAPPCRIVIPALVRLRQDFEENVAIVGVVLEDGTQEQIEANLAKFIQHYGINYPLFAHNDQETSAKFDSTLARIFPPTVTTNSAGMVTRRRGPPGVPTTVIIDQTGKIRYKHVGVPRDQKGEIAPYETFGAEVRSLLDGQ